jgi:hypothetical protein
MRLDLDREDIINLICGHPRPSMADCEKLKEAGWMRWTGNQWNESWEWNRGVLRTLSEDGLVGVYYAVKIRGIKQGLGPVPKVL